jgi:DNA-binding MarR family transcriptional regulator
MVEPTSLARAVRALARTSRLVERASQDLSFADYRVMSAISSGEERASRMAEWLALGKPAVSASIDSLSRRGLVIRARVDGDNRAVALSLSDQGIALLERMETRMARQLELLAERTEDPAAAIAALASLGDAVEQAMVERRAREAAADATE